MPLKEWMLDVDPEQADEIVRSKKMVVVELWAVWCYPCELLMKVIYSLISTGDFETYTFIRINADRFPEVYDKFRVRSLPALLGFHDGMLQERLTGFYKEDSIREFLLSLDEK